MKSPPRSVTACRTRSQKILPQTIGPDRSDCAWCSSHLSPIRSCALASKCQTSSGTSATTNRPAPHIVAAEFPRNGCHETSSEHRRALQMQRAPQFDRARGAKYVCLSSHPPDDLHADRQTVFGESDRDRGCRLACHVPRIGVRTPAPVLVREALWHIAVERIGGHWH